MGTVNPFYMWSIAEAWHWLVNLPIVGFVLLVILALSFVMLYFILTPPRLS